MKLSFFAREDLLVHHPGMMPAVGQIESFVGRRFDPKTRGYPATEEPYEVDSDSPAGQRILERMMREQPYPLWPADEETARFCNVEHCDLEFRDGVHSRMRDGKGAE